MYTTFLSTTSVLPILPAKPNHGAPHDFPSPIKRPSRLAVDYTTIRTDFSRVLAKNAKKLDLYTTAVLSLTDMLSDIAMGLRYASAGKSSFALATMFCVLLNLLFQSTGTYIQNKKLEFWRQIREQGESS